MISNSKRYPFFIIALFLILGFWYSMVVPPFEAPDEVYHYAFARHLAQGNGLPVQDGAESGENSGPWKQEGSQAPLYYMIVGGLTAGIDQGDFDQLSRRNERANIGDPLFPGNKNLMLYSSRNWPLHQTNLALHIGRWFSLLLGAITLWFIWLTARLALPEKPSVQLAAMGLVAALPQFAFISAACSNDNLITTSCAITVYWLIRLTTERNTHLVSWLVLGILLGLATLSKLQGLALIPLAGIAILSVAWQRDQKVLAWHWLLRTALAVILPCVLVAGWWYWRNYTLYGDWLGTSQLIAINGLRTDSLTVAGLWGELRGLRYSFWGLFGWFNILLPSWIYSVLDLIMVASVTGLVIAFFRNRISKNRFSFNAKAMLWLWAILCSASLVYWMIQAEGGQGRLLFPGLNAFCILLALGLDQLCQHIRLKTRLILHAATPLFLFCCSLYALIWLIPLSYGAPKPVTEIPVHAKPLHVTYDTQAEITLLAVDVPQDMNELRPGKSVPVTLYLQAAEPIEQDYQLFIQLLDERGNEISNLTAHPGWGRNPTTLWQVGQIYREHYPLLIAGNIDNQSPLQARLYTGFVNPATEESGRFPITARNEEGIEITPFVETVSVRPLEVATLAQHDLASVGVVYGDVIQLLGYRLNMQPDERTLTVTLLWEALGTPSTDYTAYVHLLDSTDQRVAGFDQMPAPRFPTRYWRAGDRIVSEFILELPEEQDSYKAWAGLYESDSQGAIRLPITDDNGWATAHNQLLLGNVE